MGKCEVISITRLYNVLLEVMMKSLKKILLGLLLIGVSINLDLNAGKRGIGELYVDNTGSTKVDGRRTYSLPGGESSSGEDSSSSEEDLSDDTNSEGEQRGAKKQRSQDVPASEFYEADDELGAVVQDAEMSQTDEENRAAIKIQAVIRGRQVRQAFAQELADQTEHEDSLDADAAVNQESKYDKMGSILQALCDYEEGLAAIADQPKSVHRFRLPEGFDVENLAQYLPGKAVSGALVVFSAGDLIATHLPVGLVTSAALGASTIASVYLVYKGGDRLGRWVLSHPEVVAQFPEQAKKVAKKAKRAAKNVGCPIQ